MRWLKRIFAPEPEPAETAPAVDGDELLRAAFECERRGELAEAERRYGVVPEDHPARAQALYYMARIALTDHRREEAVALFQGAADLCPGEALYWLSLADALYAARRFAEAVTAYESSRALQAEPSVLACNYAAALVEVGRREEARIELERLRELSPYTPQVHFNLGGIYREYCRTAEAVAAYRRALELSPGHAPSFDNLLLELNVDASFSAEAIYAEHRRFGEHFARPYTPPIADRSWPRRLRVGYVSPDFRNHVVSFFLEPVLAHHDHQRFEIFCYHVHAQKDQVTESMRPLADHWRDCEDLSDAQLAERIRSDRIDILVDLAGHTGDNRLLVFAEKPAPVQATYLGYPNTTGLTAIDYRITDPVADPPGRSERLNSERLIRLPDSHFCFRPGADAPPVEPSPAETAGFVTFGCFNHFAKISRPFLDTVARVLAAVPRSRFVLKGRPLGAPDVAAGVRRHFERAGIESTRIELRGWEPTARSHLRVYNSIDIALDSFPYGGATTTCEALWMGVPVVTYAGERHAGRMCASILTTVGLGEWVARDPDEYVSKCVELSGDLKRLAELRRGMRDRVRGSPLLDEARFTRNLEHCYIEMWERSVFPSPVPHSAGAEALASMFEQARAQRGSGEAMAAVETCQKILTDTPDHAGALELLWDVGLEAKTPGIAIEPLARGIALRPGDARLHYMLGCALQAQGSAEDAAGAFRRVLELEPRMAKAHNNLGCVLEAMGKLEEAGRSYAKAVETDPSLAQARHNLGILRDRLSDRQGAIGHISRALALEPRNAAWRCRLAELQLEDSRLDAALASFRAAAELDPDDQRILAGLGAALLQTGRVEEAGAALRRALELDPSQAWLESRLLHAEHYLGGDDAPVLFEKHQAWARRHARGLIRFTTRAPRPRVSGRRTNVAYLAPDFSDLSVAPFIEAVLAAHDRREFNVFCYSTAGGEDKAVHRLRGHGCTWRDISRMDDMQATDPIRADSIDILVDLAGHRRGGRPLLLAHRAAPVQVSWLGYPGTTGMDAVDYRLTDAVADPAGTAERWHAEKLLRLPDGFLCYTPPADAPDIAAPADLGLGHVTFACFNKIEKITTEMVALWARLLGALPRSRMILQARGFAAESARTRILEFFAARGIAADRVDLLRPDPSYSAHLARYHDIDIALDVFPYNGRATTCEALWMGVPVVTLAGRTHVSRMAASILHSAGLSDCIAQTADQYVEIALRLAQDVDGRHRLRREMRERMRASPLLDASRFARALEDAYREMLSEKSRSTQGADRAQSEPLRLHIGGKQRKPGWKILNAQPGAEVDFVGDCANDLGQFEDGSVAEIYASHVLEHLGYNRDLPRTLAECHRILHAGGIARISVPDFEVLCRLFLDPERTKDERFFVMRMVFGGQIDEYDFHHVGLTFELLHDYLKQAGFSRVERVRDFGLFDDASTLRYANVPISLNVIAFK